MPNYNTQVIDEFRANGGKVGGPFEGAPLLLLTTTGAKSGAERVNPLVYTRQDGDIVIIASKGGAPESPAWYHNLVANPKVKVEVGTETFTATAQVPQGAERDRLYAAHAAELPQFNEYQAKTTRRIPVVVLHRD